MDGFPTGTYFSSQPAGTKAQGCGCKRGEGQTSIKGRTWEKESTSEKKKK